MGYYLPTEAMLTIPKRTPPGACFVVYLTTRPTSIPIKIARPPMTSMIIPFLVREVFERFPFIIPRPKSATNEMIIELENAIFVEKNKYGEITTKPAMRYEANIMNADARDTSKETDAFCSNSFAELSDNNEPTHIENASTKMRIMPVNMIVDRGVPAAAIPEMRPMVETRLSSTPNVKLRTLSVVNIFCTSQVYHGPKYLFYGQFVDMFC